MSEPKRSGRWRPAITVIAGACVFFWLVGTLTPRNESDPVAVENTPEEIMPTIEPPTPELSPTPTPEQVARMAYEATYFNIRPLERVVVNDRVVTVRFALSGVSVDTALFDVGKLPELVCSLKDAGLTGREYQITGTIELINDAGVTSIAEGVFVSLLPETVNGMDCGVGVDLEAVADTFTLANALKQ